MLGGVALEGEAKERFNAIQQELAQLSTKFSNNVRRRGGGGRGAGDKGEAHGGGVSFSPQAVCVLDMNTASPPCSHADTHTPHRSLMLPRRSRNSSPRSPMLMACPRRRWPWLHSRLRRSRAVRGRRQRTGHGVCVGGRGGREIACQRKAMVCGWGGERGEGDSTPEEDHGV